MIRIFPVLISFLILHNWVIPIYGQDQPGTRIKEIAIEELPSEARTTLQLIEKGAPSPTNATARCSAISSAVYRSGSAVTIENLPYTPGRRDRGARRIVVGENGEFYYSEDHYRTFRQIRKGLSR